LTTIQWVFSGIGVAALGLLFRAGVFYWRKWTGANSSSLPLPVTLPIPSPPRDDSQFTKPTPDEMTKQVKGLPPYQQREAWDSYRGLEVRWEAIFTGIAEDEPANAAEPKGKKKWIVDLKHYDPSIDYSCSTIRCPGVDLEEYPQFKSLHRNDLLIVRGKLDSVQYFSVLIFSPQFEFCGRRIKGSPD
jgi:hypothetical protein